MHGRMKTLDSVMTSSKNITIFNFDLIAALKHLK